MKGTSRYPDDESTGDGRWRYEKKIGEGGFGLVWRVTELRTGSTVAIKVLKNRRKKDALQASREVQFTKRFQNLIYPATGQSLFAKYLEDCTGFEDYADDAAHLAWSEGCLWKGMDADSVIRPKPYIVMEYIPGSTVSSLLSRQFLTPRELIEIIHQSAVALEYLWKHRCIHRDFRVHNLMWHNHQLKVLDFGLCLHHADPSYATSTNFLFCTYWNVACYWMPPEVKRRLPVCNFYKEAPASFDIYSLGVMALEFMLHAKDTPLLTKSKKFIEDANKQRMQPHLAHSQGYINSAQLLQMGFTDEMFARIVSEHPGERPTATEIIACLDAHWPVAKRKTAPRRPHGKVEAKNEKPGAHDPKMLPPQGRSEQVRIFDKKLEAYAGYRGDMNLLKDLVQYFLAYAAAGERFVLRLLSFCRKAIASKSEPGSVFRVLCLVDYALHQTFRKEDSARKEGNATHKQGEDNANTAAHKQGEKVAGPHYTYIRAIFASAIGTLLKYAALAYEEEKETNARIQRFVKHWLEDKFFTRAELDAIADGFSPRKREIRSSKLATESNKQLKRAQRSHEQAKRQRVIVKALPSRVHVPAAEVKDETTRLVEPRPLANVAAGCAEASSLDGALASVQPAEADGVTRPEVSKACGSSAHTLPARLVESSKSGNSVGAFPPTIQAHKASGSSAQTLPAERLELSKSGSWVGAFPPASQTPGKAHSSTRRELPFEPLESESVIGFPTKSSGSSAHVLPAAPQESSAPAGGPARAFQTDMHDSGEASESLAQTLPAEPPESSTPAGGPPRALETDMPAAGKASGSATRARRAKPPQSSRLAGRSTRAIPTSMHAPGNSSGSIKRALPAEPPESNPPGGGPANAFQTDMHDSGEASESLPQPPPAEPPESCTPAGGPPRALETDMPAAGKASGSATRARRAKPQSSKAVGISDCLFPTPAIQAGKSSSNSTRPLPVEPLESSKAVGSSAHAYPSVTNVGDGLAEMPPAVRPALVGEDPPCGSEAHKTLERRSALQASRSPRGGGRPGDQLCKGKQSSNDTAESTDIGGDTSTSHSSVPLTDEGTDLATSKPPIAKKAASKAQSRKGVKKVLKNAQVTPTSVSAIADTAAEPSPSAEIAAEKPAQQSANARTARAESRGARSRKQQSSPSKTASLPEGPNSAPAVSMADSQRADLPATLEKGSQCVPAVTLPAWPAAFEGTKREATTTVAKSPPVELPQSQRVAANAVPPTNLRGGSENKSRRRAIPDLPSTHTADVVKRRNPAAQKPTFCSTEAEVPTKSLHALPSTSPPEFSCHTQPPRGHHFSPNSAHGSSPRQSPGRVEARRSRTPERLYPTATRTRGARRLAEVPAVLVSSIPTQLSCAGESQLAMCRSRNSRMSPPRRVDCNEVVQYQPKKPLALKHVKAVSEVRGRSLYERRYDNNDSPSSYASSSRSCSRGSSCSQCVRSGSSYSYCETCGYSYGGSSGSESSPRRERDFTGAHTNLGTALVEWTTVPANGGFAQPPSPPLPRQSGMRYQQRECDEGWTRDRFDREFQPSPSVASDDRSIDCASPRLMLDDPFAFPPLEDDNPHAVPERFALHDRFGQSESQYTTKPREKRRSEQRSSAGASSTRCPATHSAGSFTSFTHAPAASVATPCDQAQVSPPSQVASANSRHARGALGPTPRYGPLSIKRVNAAPCSQDLALAPYGPSSVVGASAQWDPSPDSSAYIERYYDNRYIEPESKRRRLSGREGERFANGLLAKTPRYHQQGMYRTGRRHVRRHHRRARVRSRSLSSRCSFYDSPST